LRSLAEECQESVNLVVLDGDQVVNLEQFVPPARQVKNIGQVGRRLCPHCTAAGKVLLAHLSQEELDQVLSGELEKHTAHTITDSNQLRRDLNTVRRQGYAIAREELEEGLNALAAPLYDHTGQAVAAVGVAGPAYRMTAQALPQMVACLLDVTRQISARLGHRWP
jgi:DNA-binding IclR family transcriptional regulator